MKDLQREWFVCIGVEREWGCMGGGRDGPPIPSRGRGYSQTSAPL